MFGWRLNRAGNLNELKYIFNALKPDPKNGMKTFLKANAKPIFEANPIMFKQLNKADGRGKIEDWEDLYDLANSSVTNNILFSIVESL